MKQRGRILRDTSAGPGILIVDGKQYTFTLEEMWRSHLPPRIGMLVEIIFDSEGAPQAVFMVPEGQVAKEQAEKALADVRQYGQAITRPFSHFGLPVVVAELLMLIFFFAVPNAAYGVAVEHLNLTGWNLTGFNPETGMVNEHGFLSLLAIVCLFAPLASPFWRNARSRWFYAAPLAACLLTLIVVFAEVHKMGRAATEGADRYLGAGSAAQIRSEITGMFSLRAGIFVVLLCAGYLAMQCFKRRPTMRALSGSALSLFFFCSFVCFSSERLWSQTPVPTVTAGTQLDADHQKAIRLGRQMGAKAYDETPASYGPVAKMPAANILTSGIRKGLEETGTIRHDQKFDQSIEGASKTFHSVIDQVPEVDYSMLEQMPVANLQALAARYMVLDLAAAELKRTLTQFEGNTHVDLPDKIPPNQQELGRGKLIRQVARLEEARSAFKEADRTAKMDPLNSLGEQTSHIAYNRAKIALDNLPAAPKD